jgi:hypothetical protein
MKPGVVKRAVCHLASKVNVGTMSLTCGEHRRCNNDGEKSEHALEVA